MNDHDKMFQDMEDAKHGAMNPPILPWHREAAKKLGDIMAETGVIESDDDIAAIIASCDPAAAQHAETVRLLSEVLNEIELTDPTGLAVLARIQLVKEIQAHLATLRGGRKEPNEPDPDAAS